MNYTCLTCDYEFFIEFEGVECSTDKSCPKCGSKNTDLTENITRNEAINRADEIAEDKRLFQGD